MTGGFRPSPLDRHDLPAPAARVLGAAAYRVLVSASGAGLSLAGPLALTAWPGDRVADADGFFLFLRDLGSGRYRRIGDPREPANAVRATRGPGTFTIEDRGDGLAARIEVAVRPDAGLEIRRATVRNDSAAPRRLELVSFAEAVLNDPAAHLAHPVFSKLFLQTEFVPEPGLLLVRRRPRSGTERFPVLFHALAGAPAAGFETDRARFLGRGRPGPAPLALAVEAPAGTQGNVLDPVVSLRARLDLAPGESRSVAFVLGAAGDRESALAGAARFGTPGAVETAFAEAAADDLALWKRLGLSAAEADYAESLAGALLYGDPRLRAPRAPGALAEDDGLGLSGRVPTVVAEAGRDPSPWPR